MGQAASTASHRHRRGMEALRSVLRMASQLGIRHLTVYAFSAENWSRPADEVDTIMTYLVRFLRTEIPELNQNNIQLMPSDNWIVCHPRHRNSCK